MSVKDQDTDVCRLQHTDKEYPIWILKNRDINSHILLLAELAQNVTWMAQ